MTRAAAGADAGAGAVRAGPRFGERSVHTSRTIMLADLGELFAAVPPEAVREDYRAAIVDENVLGKATAANRRGTGQRLGELYALDPRVPLFRVLRRLWSVDVRDGRCWRCSARWPAVRCCARRRRPCSPRGGRSSTPSVRGRAGRFRKRRRGCKRKDESGGGRTTTVDVRRGTLADEAAVRDWPREQERKLLAAVREGPVIVR